jgi:general secretion pathway protein B
MSYILDALRKADAERERDPARGIHARPMAAQPAAQRASYAPWAAAGLAVAALAGYAWSQRSPAPVAPLRPVAAPSDPMPAVAPPKVITVAAALQPAPPPPLPQPVKAAVLKAPPAPARVAASAAGAPERIYAQTELPADVQQALPKLAISGGVYSENVAQRMLVVGGQVVGEGKELAPGLVLDQIGPRNAVLKFRGYKYSVIF